MNTKKPHRRHARPSAVKKPSAKPVRAKRSGRERLEVFSKFELRIRDPYLLDALRQFTRVLADLRTLTDLKHVEKDVYLLCELSRDITSRLIPFSAEMIDVFEHANKQYQQVLEILANKPANKDISRYVANIRKRAEQYTEFVNSVPRS